jgi:hypothetical protein
LGDAEFERPALTHHSLILFTKPPYELDLRYEDVKRHRPLPISLGRAGWNTDPLALARDEEFTPRLPTAEAG